MTEISPHQVRLGEALVRELNKECYLTDNHTGEPVCDLEVGEMFKIGRSNVTVEGDGSFNLLGLVRALEAGVAYLPDEEPPTYGRYIVQIRDHPWETIPAHYIGDKWVLDSGGEVTSCVICWWHLPGPLTPEQILMVPTARNKLPPGEPREQCPKCHRENCTQESGYDWSGCRGECPVPDSPHYKKSVSRYYLLTHRPRQN